MNLPALLRRAVRVGSDELDLHDRQVKDTQIFRISSRRRSLAACSLRTVDGRQGKA
jgi:hypothetical protein